MIFADMGADYKNHGCFFKKYATFFRKLLLHLLAIMPYCTDTETQR